MLYAVYVLVVLIFCVSFYFTHILYTCHGIFDIARSSTGILTNANLDDLVKEKAIKKAALDMVKQCLVLFLKITIVLVSTTIPVLIADFLKLATLYEIGMFAARWDVLLITTIVILVPVIALRR